MGPFWDLLHANRTMIVVLTVVMTLLGLAYAVFAQPTFQSSLLLQVEDNPNASTSLLENVQQMFDQKSATSDQIEIFNSRLVLSRVVEKYHLNVRAEPRYFPMIGRWVAERRRHAHDLSLSNPGLLGWGGFVWGAERAELGSFEMPAEFYGRRFKLVAGDGGRYRLLGSFSDIDVDIDASGRLGEPLNIATPYGPIRLVVTSLEARPGAAFKLSRVAVVTAVDDLQRAMDVTQPTKDSDLIRASLQGSNALQVASVLNDIGDEYVAQDAERRSVEAQRSIEFLNRELPRLKHQLEESEDAYNAFRAQHMTLDLGTQDTNILQQSVDAQTKLAELEQKRSELLATFMPQHASVVAVDSQIATLRARVAQIESQTRQLPELEQMQVRLQRDVKVNTELYTGLLNNLQQLDLARASKGNSRIVDHATPADKPVKPKRWLVLALSTIIGLCVGVAIAWVRQRLFGGITQPREIEAASGLPVLASVLFSSEQARLDKRRAKLGGVRLLAHAQRDSLTVESLRSLRSALRTTLPDAHNNVVLISGAEPNVGKSFTSANLAAVLAASNQRVLLIDGDLRRGDLGRHFNVSAAPGLSELIGGEAKLEQVVHRDVLPKLDLITRGSIPPNPSELLLSPPLGDLVRAASANYDVVIIDSPAALPVDDAATLGQHAGTALIVARHRVTTAGRLAEATKRLTQAGVLLKGVVLNGFHPSTGLHGYRYRSHYTPHKGSVPQQVLVEALPPEVRK
jgi:tyrosine-protein kinase Etk/Wzc